MKEKYDFAKAAEYALEKLDGYNDTDFNNVDRLVTESGCFNRVLGTALSFGVNIPSVTNADLYVTCKTVNDYSVFMFAFPYGNSGYVDDPDFWADLTLGGIQVLVAWVS